jgi:hypothetical protein
MQLSNRSLELLQSLQGSFGPAPLFRCVEKASKKFNRVTQLLRPYAQSVLRVLVKRIEVAALPPEPSDGLPHLRLKKREERARGFIPVDPPFSGFQPNGEIEEQQTKARGFDGFGQLSMRVDSPFLHRRGKLEIAFARLPTRELPVYRFRLPDIEIPRRSKKSRNPPEANLKPGEIRILDARPEKAHCGPQTTNCDPRLMNRFDVHSPIRSAIRRQMRRGKVQHEIMQARPANCDERIRDGRITRKVNLRSFAGHG